MTSIHKFFLSFLIILAVCIYHGNREVYATGNQLDEFAQEVVGKWERFEATIINKRSYSDPYNDVHLNVICETPGGREITFRGFYDGGQTWRFRFMPDATGLWRYKAVFSDGTPGKSGEFRVVESNLPGILTVNKSNLIWFSSMEKPVLIRGFHIGDRFFAANWADEKRNAFLDWAENQGYNFLTIASHYLNRDEENRGRGWETPKLWPLDAAEYRKMELILDDLAARGIYVYPFAGFFGKNSNYPTDPVEQEQYIQYTLARIGSYWNLVYNVAGPEPNLSKTCMA